MYVVQVKCKKLIQLSFFHFFTITKTFHGIFQCQAYIYISIYIVTKLAKLTEYHLRIILYRTLILNRNDDGARFGIEIVHNNNNSNKIKKNNKLHDSNTSFNFIHSILYIYIYNWIIMFLRFLFHLVYKYIHNKIIILFYMLLFSIWLKLNLFIFLEFALSLHDLITCNNNLNITYNNLIIILKGSNSSQVIICNNSERFYNICIRFP